MVHELHIMLMQVQEALRAVEGEGDPATWVLKLTVILALTAVGYLGKLLLERPRPREVERIQELNESLREQVEACEREVRELEREMQKMQHTITRYGMVIRQNELEVPEEIGGS